MRVKYYLPLLLLLFTSSFGVNYVMTCQNINSPGDYVLSSDLLTPGSCIRITADNVNLDCNGYKIRGSSSYGSYGIFIDGASNVEVSNCDVEFFYRAIIVDTASDVQLNNIVVKYNDGTYGSGMRIVDSQRVTVDGITPNANDNIAIYVADSPDTTFYDVSAAQPSSAYTFYVKRSDNFHLERYNDTQSYKLIYIEDSDYISLKTLKSTSNKYGIRGRDLRYPEINGVKVNSIDKQAIYLNDDDGIGIQNAIVKNVDVNTGANDNCIVIGDAPNLVMDNVSASNCNGGSGIVIDNAPHSTLTNLESHYNSETGVLVTTSSNSYIDGVTALADGDYGISIAHLENLTLGNVTANNAGSNDLYLKDVNYSTFRNMFLSNSGRHGARLSGSSHNYFDNITVISNSDSGFSLVYNSNYNSLVNINSTLNENDGISIYYSSYNDIQNSISYLNYYSGFKFAEEAKYNTLSNSIVEQNAGCLLLPIGGCPGDQDKYANIKFYHASYNTVSDMTIRNSYGTGVIFYNNWGQNVLTKSNIYNNSYAAIRVYSEGIHDWIYDNLINDTTFVYDSGDEYWNTTLHAGTNIVYGTLIGGNYWGKPDGTGFSDTCLDDDENGICDLPYAVTSTGTDYYPLTYPKTTSYSVGLVYFVPPTPDNDSIVNYNDVGINITTNLTENYTQFVIHLYNLYNASFYQNYSCTTPPCYNLFEGLPEASYYTVGEMYMINSTIYRTEKRFFGVNISGNFCSAY